VAVEGKGRGKEEKKEITMKEGKEGKGTNGQKHSQLLFSKSSRILAN